MKKELLKEILVEETSVTDEEIRENMFEQAMANQGITDISNISSKDIKRFLKE